MKSSTFFTLASLIFCGTALADIPVKKPLQSYSKLWAPSPFTKPRVETGPVTPDNIFKDYHLTGIAPIDGGYLITIANKKSKEKIVIEPDSNSKFKVLKVDRNPDVYLGTVVTLTHGGTQGEVRFEPELVVLNTPATQNPGQQFPPGFNPNQPNIQADGQVVAPPQTPRSRIIAPPASTNPGQKPAVSPQNPGQNRGGSPQNRGGGSTQSRPPRNR